MTDLDRLCSEIAREEDEIRARSDTLERVRARLEAFETAPSRRNRFRFALGVAVSLAFALGGVVGFVGDRRALRVNRADGNTAVAVGERLVASETRSLPLAFSDGTRIEMAPGARAHLAELESDGARLVLERGRAKVDVVHRSGARWNLSAGPFTVRVTGTRFELTYTPETDELELSLAEGQVELSGCVFGAGKRLAAGQTVRASCKRQDAQIAFKDATSKLPPAVQAAASPNASAPALPPKAAEPAAEVPADASGASANTEARPKTSAARAEARTEANAPPDGRESEARPELSAEARSSERVWLKLAKKGMYREAFAAAEEEGFEAECQRAQASELALLGDAARHAGNADKATQAFLLLRRKFAGTSEAALAAFALGRLEFDANGAYAKAANWFRIYLAEQRGGTLAREALGRLIESLHRAGDKAAARELAVTYLRDYPAGPHAELSSRIAAEQ